jgi:hypothetical protein
MMFATVLLATQARFDAIRSNKFVKDTLASFAKHFSSVAVAAVEEPKSSQRVDEN